MTPSPRSIDAMVAEKVKILFLDFDGVLNSCNWFRGRAERRLTNPDESTESSHIDPSAVGHLNSIIEDTGCLVVISSAWRRGHSVGELLRLLVSKGMDKKHWDNFVGMTPVLQTERGHEIQAWMDNHRHYNIETIAILDDDGDMAHLMPHLIYCHGIEGLTYEVACRAINKLNAICLAALKAKGITI